MFYRLGNGAAGNAFLCVNESLNRLFVVKQAKSAQNCAGIMREASIYKIINSPGHRNVMSSPSELLPAPGDVLHGPGLVLEYCSLGSMQDCTSETVKLELHQVRCNILPIMIYECCMNFFCHLVHQHLDPSPQRRQVLALEGSRPLRREAWKSFDG